MTITLTPYAGTIDDIRHEDDCGGDGGHGYERDETDKLHRVVRQLVADGIERLQDAYLNRRRT
ncbi:hypothetical protein ACWD9K_25170 [Streptomyces sp. 900116325]